jgi:hypothetical protein
LKLARVADDRERAIGATRSGTVATASASSMIFLAARDLLTAAEQQGKSVGIDNIPRSSAYISIEIAQRRQDPCNGRGG